MKDNPQTTASDAALDKLIMMNTSQGFPLRSDTKGWLHIAETTMVNTRYLMNHGKSETADSIFEHYWRRWGEACQNEGKGNVNG